MRITLALLLLCCCHARLPRAAELSLPTKIEFNHDVRPDPYRTITSTCHGPDPKHREADLRLDVRDEALASEAFVPAKPQQSALVARICSDDPQEQMPPPESNKKLSERQKEILKRWIAQGATYQRRGAIRKAGQGQHFCRTKRHRRAGRSAAYGARPRADAPLADRRTLIRRLYADLLRPASYAATGAGFPERPVARRLRE